MPRYREQRSPLVYISESGGGGSGPFSPEDWIEITGGTLVDSDTQLSGFSHSPSTGLTIGWKAATGRSDLFDVAPCLVQTFEDLGHADFDWDTHGIDLLLTVDETALNETSPFEHGFALSVVDSTFQSGQGIGYTARGSGNVNSGTHSGAGFGTAFFDDQLIGVAAQLRKYNTTTDPNVLISLFRWENGTFRSVDQRLGSGAGTLMFTDPASDLQLAVYGIQDTTSARPEMSYSGRAYYRITRLRSMETAADILALA